jgi:hypothetical protein
MSWTHHTNTAIQCQRPRLPRWDDDDACVVPAKQLIIPSALRRSSLYDYLVETLRYSGYWERRLDQRLRRRSPLDA